MRLVTEGPCAQCKEHTITQSGVRLNVGGVRRKPAPLQCLSTAPSLFVVIKDRGGSVCLNTTHHPYTSLSLSLSDL